MTLNSRKVTKYNYFFDLPIINIISLSLAGWIKSLAGHMEPMAVLYGYLLYGEETNHNMIKMGQQSFCQNPSKYETLLTLRLVSETIKGGSKSDGKIGKDLKFANCFLEH